VVSPSGELDGTQAQRLRDVLESRQGAYESVVVDLRDVSGFGQDGLGLLLEQQQWAREQGIPLAIVPGAIAREALTRLDSAGDLAIADDIDDALAPHRD